MNGSEETADFEASKRARKAALDDSLSSARPSDDPEPKGRARANTAVWLVAGGALAVLMLAFFIYGFTLQIVVPIIGLIVTIGLYIGLVVAALTIPHGRKRLRALAIIMGALALSMLVLGLVFYGIEAASFEQINSVP